MGELLRNVGNEVFPSEPVSETNSPAGVSIRLHQRAPALVLHQRMPAACVLQDEACQCSYCVPQSALLICSIRAPA